MLSTGPIRYFDWNSSIAKYSNFCEILIFLAEKDTVNYRYYLSSWPGRNWIRSQYFINAFFKLNLCWILIRLNVKFRYILDCSLCVFNIKINTTGILAIKAVITAIKTIVKYFLNDIIKLIFLFFNEFNDAYLNFEIKLT